MLQFIFAETGNDPLCVLLYLHPLKLLIKLLDYHVYLKYREDYSFREEYFCCTFYP